MKTSLKRQQSVTRHKQNHMMPDHDQVNPRAPNEYLKVLETFEISQSLNNSVSNNQLEHLKKRGVHKSRADL